jgi:hypothetical protein
MMEIPENYTTTEFSVQFYIENSYLFVKLAGPWTADTALKSMQLIKVEADKHEVRNILLDFTGMMRPENEMVRYYTGEYIADIFKTHYRLAGFTQAFKINGFTETVAVNRNANFRIFTDEKLARDWLLLNEIG